MKKSAIKKISQKRKDRLSWYSEKDLFFEIRNNRIHECKICGKFIPEAKTRCFAHMLSKKMYPEYRINPNNIVLVCSLDCHWLVDSYCKWNKKIIEDALENKIEIDINILCI